MMYEDGIAKSFTKIALFGALMGVGFGAMDTFGKTKELKAANQLTQASKRPRLDVGPSSNYSFDGGKHMPGKQNQLPHERMF